MKFFLIASLYLILNIFASPIDCGDLLSQYAEKPKNLEFLECKKGTGQTILQAEYKVAGKDAKKVERFFVKKYDMGKLKFTCCGWEPTNGKNGYIEHPELTKINPFYTLEISMFGSEENQNEKGEILPETDRTKIDFQVVVKLLEV